MKKVVVIAACVVLVVTIVKKLYEPRYKFYYVTHGCQS